MADEIMRGIMSGKSIAAYRAEHSADAVPYLAGAGLEKASSGPKDEEPVTFRKSQLDHAAEAARREERDRCAEIVCRALGMPGFNAVVKEIYGA